MFEKMFDGDNEHQGLYAYNSIIKGITKFKGLDGFLYKHDDLIFNATNLYNFDLTKIWTTWDGNTIHHVKYWGDDMLERKKQNFWWWNYPKVLDNAKKLLKDNEVRQILTTCTGSVEKWYVGGGGSSDMLYIPVGETNNYIKTINKFSDAQLYLEIAIPTYLRCFAKTPFLKLTKCYRLSDEDWDKYRKRY